jgi:hypothetical protein
VSWQNAKQILNLSPNYLFNLSCFSDILPDSQADLLFDNIQFLNNVGGEQDDGPQVFLISGWGEPGTASRRDPDPGPDYRASWTCWCAAHRPSPVTNSAGTADTSLLVILEFELERDPHNPLYPPVNEAEFRSGMSSPSSVEGGATRSTTTEGESTPDSVETRSTQESTGTGGSSAHGSTGTGGTGDSAPRSTGSAGAASSLTSSSAGTPGSGADSPAGSSVVGRSSTSLLSGNTGSGSSSQTLVSTDSSARDRAMYNNMEGASLSGSTAADVLSSRGDSMSPGLILTDQSSRLQPFVLPNSDEEWLPQPQHILESTTSRAKPLLALERLRRMSRAVGSDSPPTGPRPGIGRRTRTSRRGGGGGNGVGMMDVFAVMAQINEQLGAAEDLETFLKISVGVIKDLTQFHRVLVYQFDEMWNGQVVAELVDWHQTHDLYMGLHFPASDIPAQVGPHHLR